MQFLNLILCLDLSKSLEQIAHECTCKLTGLTYMGCGFSCGICRPAIRSFWKTWGQLRSNRYIYMAGFNAV